MANKLPKLPACLNIPHLDSAIHSARQCKQTFIAQRDRCDRDALVESADQLFVALVVYVREPIHAARDDMLVVHSCWTDRMCSGDQFEVSLLALVNSISNLGCQVDVPHRCRTINSRRDNKIAAWADGNGRYWCVMVDFEQFLSNRIAEVHWMFIIVFWTVVLIPYVTTGAVDTCFVITTACDYLLHVFRQSYR